MSRRIDYRTAAPKGMQAFGGVHAYIDQSGLPRTLVNLVYLRISQINGCPYCVATHARDLIKEGVAAEKLLLLPVWRESGEHFSAAERAALRWAEAVTHVAAAHPSEADYQAAAAQFSDKELADLTFSISLINAYNRIAISFRQGPDGALLENEE
jgi:AhpD family alkylhydroperoxidase